MPTKVAGGDLGLPRISTATYTPDRWGAVRTAAESFQYTSRFDTTRYPWNQPATAEQEQLLGDQLARRGSGGVARVAGALPAYLVGGTAETAVTAASALIPGATALRFGFGASKALSRSFLQGATIGAVGESAIQAPLQTIKVREGRNTPQEAIREAAFGIGAVGLGGGVLGALGGAIGKNVVRAVPTKEQVAQRARQAINPNLVDDLLDATTELKRNPNADKTKLRNVWGKVQERFAVAYDNTRRACLLYTSPSPRDS